MASAPWWFAAACHIAGPPAHCGKRSPRLSRSDTIDWRISARHSTVQVGPTKVTVIRVYSRSLFPIRGPTPADRQPNLSMEIVMPPARKAAVSKQAAGCGELRGKAAPPKRAAHLPKKSAPGGRLRRRSHNGLNRIAAELAEGHGPAKAERRWANWWKFIISRRATSPAALASNSCKKGATGSGWVEPQHGDRDRGRQKDRLPACSEGEPSRCSIEHAQAFALVVMGILVSRSAGIWNLP